MLDRKKAMITSIEGDNFPTLHPALEQKMTGSMAELRAKKSIGNGSLFGKSSFSKIRILN